MTTKRGREAALSRVCWTGAALTVLALAGLATSALPGSARAASGAGYDQITGIGVTASAVTVGWTQGILDASNQPIASANADRGRPAAQRTSPYGFMYDDFQGLQVKVSQTADLGHQGITVSWSGGKQTVYTGGVAGDFLQMMECYGDASTGPTPEQCEYGSARMLGPNGGIAQAQIGQRTGSLCQAGATPNPAKPAVDLNGSAVTGCDPLQTTAGHSYDIAPCPPSVNPACDTSHTTFSIPFIPVAATDSSSYVYGQLSTYYQASNSNEVQFAPTGPGGSGQRQFETLTSVQSPGLGCGGQDASQGNQARGCWLVIVPRGMYEPNGFAINPNSINPGIGSLVTSPLSAANWAQRIQVHLSYAPLQAYCPVGTLERQTEGTQLILRAMQSWQVALNQQGNCKRIYAFSVPPGEAAVTQDMQDTTTSGVGLGFTTIPLGAEATRYGGSPPTLPNIVYAPVAVVGVDFGSNISQTIPGGTIEDVTKPIELTPLLVAKALTQSYISDLPEYYPADQKSHPLPSWAASNWTDISHDPEFTKLNSEVVPFTAGGAISLGPLTTEDHSAVNQQVWQWIQADPTAAGWLDGTPDKSDGNMVVDQSYQVHNLGKAPAIDGFPRDYPGKLTVPNPVDATKTISRDSIDVLPYAASFNDAMAAVLAGNDASVGSTPDPTVQNPDGTFGAFAKVGIEPAGQLFMWAAGGTPDLAAYGLYPATLCNAAGTTCVAPSVASVSAALKSATADPKTGVLQVNPAKVGSGAWPLTQVIYAAVPTNQPAAALTDYADLISYAAGTGQTAGTASGDLPPGYLPLPASLRAQAQAAVAKLRSVASPQPTHTPTSSATTSGGGSGSGGSGSGGSGSGSGSGSGGNGASNPTPTAGPGPGSGASAAAAAPTPSSGPTVIGPTVQLDVGSTPRQPVGKIQWALVTVLIIGLLGASGGILLRHGARPRLPRLPRFRRTEW